MVDPIRGEILLADLGTGRGHEQAGQPPVLVVSDDAHRMGQDQLLPQGISHIGLAHTVPGFPGVPSRPRSNKAHVAAGGGDAGPRAVPGGPYRLPEPMPPQGSGAG
jgi:hypothetical protein